MDEAKFAAEFFSANFTKISEIAKKAYGKIDQRVRLDLKVAYSEYLYNVYKRYSKSKSFFIRSQSVDLYDYYVPVGIANEAVDVKEPSFSEVLSISNRLVIHGTGGCGKTVLMKHLFLDCILNRRYAPILIELRDFNDAEGGLDDLIFSSLKFHGFYAEENFIEKAKEEGHFAFFLDGFDEVDHQHRSRLVGQINKLQSSYLRCPVFISSRPDETFEGYDEFDSFKVMPLSLDGAKSLIEKLPYDNDVKQKFVSDLDGGLFNTHRSFLSNPLLLSIMLLTYGENAEIPSKTSIFYQQAYEVLFQRHDAHKKGFRRKKLTGLDILDFSRVFSLFALQTYERRLFKMPRTDCLGFIEKSRDSLHKDFASEDYLNDCLSAACLLVEDGLDIAFSHRSFQE